MFALIAAILFAVALILQIVGGTDLVVVLTLGGFLCVALHLLWGTWPWRTPPS